MFVVTKYTDLAGLLILGPYTSRANAEAVGGVVHELKVPATTLRGLALLTGVHLSMHDIADVCETMHLQSMDDVVANVAQVSEYLTKYYR